MATGVKFSYVEVTDFIASKQTTHPELSAEWLKLEELYNKKLWHQLTLKIQELVEKPTMQAGDNLITLYTNFLSYFENKINPLSLVEITAHVIKQYTNKKEAIAFLEKIEVKVKANDEALALCKVLQGQIYLEQLNDLDSTEKIIEQLEGTLEDADGVTPVHGRFYKLASEYYRVRGPMARYYRSALRYVGCAGGGADLAPEERRAIALRLALAAVIAPTVYDLGELLAHPILESLHGTPDAWACELVRAVASGDVALFEKVRATAQHPDLARTDRQLRQKIAILCLMEMAFNRTSAQRKLTFAEIAREARVPIDEVELLVMKALAEKLIRGHIDQDAMTATPAAPPIKTCQIVPNHTSLGEDLWRRRQPGRPARSLDTHTSLRRPFWLPSKSPSRRCRRIIAAPASRYTYVPQVNSTAHIGWVRPRALPRCGAAALAQRLDTWCAAVAGAADLLANAAPDLLTA